MSAVVPRAIVLAGLLSLAAVAGAAQDRVLTLHDVSPELADLIGGSALDFVAQERIEYGVTGKSAYDTFYRSSAIAYGGMVVGRGLTDDATMNLKKYARSKAAVAELEQEIAVLTEGADTTEWTTEQSLAVLRAAEKRDQLSDEEREYMITTGALMALTIPVVEASVEESVRLTGQVSGLVSGARSAFGFTGAAGAARNVKRSADRLSDIPTEGPALVESMVILSTGLSMVAGDG
jgi:hypothetical protein